jgi:hypothetical protein
MSKRKQARTAKARTKARTKDGSRQTAHHHPTRAHSKQAHVLALLRGSSGVSIATLMRSTGWQPHTVRSFLAAVVRKKLGLHLESEKANGERVYRVVACNRSDSAGGPSA